MSEKKLRIEHLPISKINPASYNPRKALKSGDPEYEALLRSVEQFGLVEPLVWNKRTGNLVGGHQRLSVIKARGDKSVDVVVLDLDDKQEKALNIALNKISGEWNIPKLKELLVELDDGSFDITLTGFSEHELKELIDFDGIANGEEQDAVPEPPKKAVTKPGDLWLLGEHRLLCGDSTKMEDISALMGAEKADMCFTDPPYGVNYDGGIQIKNGVFKKGAREKLAGDETSEIYTKAIEIISRITDGPCYTFFSGTNAREIYCAMDSHKCQIHALIIWVKNGGYGALNSCYKQKHEPMLFWKPKGARLRWEGPTTENTIWEIKKDGKNDFHPTQKPVDLPMRAISNHDVESVVDLFAGSGSVIVAAEKIGIKSFLCELSPNYCDVIVKRWENLTGKKAKLAK